MFSNKRRHRKQEQKDIWNDYVFHKQTIRELTNEYDHDRKTIQTLLHEYEPPQKIHTPRAVHLTTDTTYFGEHLADTDWCVVVARDHVTGEDLVWQCTKTESTSAYLALREELESLGYTILSVTGDGFGGIRSAFRGIPYQMCLVHMERIVVRGTTKKPQTEAGQVLLALTKSLHETNKKRFSERLTAYLDRYHLFLNERTTNPLTRETFWTHQKLRQASLSLVRQKPFLFTHFQHSDIASTTNSLEGRFSHIKDVLSIHRGLSQTQQQKIIHSLLLASSIAPSDQTLKNIL